MPPTTEQAPATALAQPADPADDAGSAPLTTTPDVPADGLTLLAPSIAHGGPMWRLARDSGSLDLNTSYAYLLYARDFADTCRVAVADGAVVGFLLGYRRPTEPGTLFVWQIAVDAAQRGKQLASRLLDQLSADLRVSHVEATITSDNTASQRLFEGFARRHGTQLVRDELFTTGHFPDGHASEGLVRIGPLAATG